MLLHTKVLVGYSALLERAATQQDVKLQVGALLDDAKKSVLLKKSIAKLPNFVTTDAVDQVVNGVVDLLANRARSDALSQAVRAADPLVQSLSSEFEQYFGGTDVCTPEAVLQAQRAPQWCIVFDGELTFMKQGYGALVSTEWPYAGDRAQLDPTVLAAAYNRVLAQAEVRRNYSAALDAYIGLIKQIRARTQRGVDLTSVFSYNSLEGAARNAARRHDSATLLALYGEALATVSLADKPQLGVVNSDLQARLDADLTGYKGSIAAGTDFADAVRKFATGHARLLALINQPVPANTAVFDR
jgi:hypothetical protein